MQLMVTGARMGKTTECIRLLRESKHTAVVVNTPMIAKRMAQEFELTPAECRQLLVLNELFNGAAKGQGFTKVIFDNLDQILTTIAWSGLGPVNEVMATATAEKWEVPAPGSAERCPACFDGGLLHLGCGK